MGFIMFVIKINKYQEDLLLLLLDNLRLVQHDKLCGLPGKPFANLFKASEEMTRVLKKRSGDAFGIFERERQIIIRACAVGLKTMFKALHEMPGDENAIGDDGWDEVLYLLRAFSELPGMEQTQPGVIHSICL